MDYFKVGNYIPYNELKINCIIDMVGSYLDYSKVHPVFVNSNNLRFYNTKKYVCLFCIKNTATKQILFGDHFGWYVCSECHDTAKNQFKLRYWKSCMLMTGVCTFDVSFRFSNDKIVFGLIYPWSNVSLLDDDTQILVNCKYLNFKFDYMFQMTSFSNLYQNCENFRKRLRLFCKGKKTTFKGCRNYLFHEFLEFKHLHPNVKKTLMRLLETNFSDPKPFNRLKI
jgi:hypothetical protein